MAKTREALMYSAYFAPRGMVRMTEMGRMIAARHLSPFDRLIGIVGEAGSGKSMLERSTAADSVRGRRRIFQSAYVSP